jgi:hypothetical protein
MACSGAGASAAGSGVASGMDARENSGEAWMPSAFFSEGGQQHTPGWDLRRAEARA